MSAGAKFHSTGRGNMSNKFPLDDYCTQTGIAFIKHFFTNPKKANPKKDKLTNYLIRMQLRRTLQMFNWSIQSNGKPSTKIDKRNLELLIQTYGLAGIIKHNDELYALFGTLGGEPNWNYMPTKFICANAFLNLSKEYNIYDTDKGQSDCVIIPNDSLYQGMLPSLSYHSEMITEIELTKKQVLVWLRAPHTFSAPTSNAKKDVEDYLALLESGELGAIFDKSFLRNILDIGGDNTSSRGILTQVLEVLQYEKASMFNDCGLEMNYNMKRESITSSEAQLGEGSLLPTPDDMMDMRKLACKRVKEVFDEDWSVEFGSAWKVLHESIDLELKEKETNNSSQLEKEVTDGKVGDDGSDGSEREPGDRGSSDNDEPDEPDNGSSDGKLEEVLEELDVAVSELEEVVQSTGKDGEENEDT